MLQLEDGLSARFGLGKAIRKKKTTLKRIMYNPKTKTCYTLREDNSLSAAPLIMGALSLAKKAIQSPGGQKVIGSIFKKKAPAANQAVQNVGLNAELQQKVKNLMIENKNLKTNLQTTEAAKNAYQTQRYFFGAGGFAAGAAVGYMLKR